MFCETINARQTRPEVYRILIVDDESAIGEVLEEALRSPLRSIEVRENPHAALEFLQHNAVDLAFVDANLPGMSGLELARRIKERYPRAHIVICTGYFGSEITAQPEAEHVDRVLTKPVDFGELLQLADSYATE